LEVQGLSDSKKELDGQVRKLETQKQELEKVSGKLRGVLQLAGDHVTSLEDVESKLFTAVDDIKKNNEEQRRRQLRDIFMKFDVDIDGEVSSDGKDGSTEQLDRLKRYIAAVYNKKMEKLHLDLNGDGQVSWDEYVQVLMADNFWHDEPPVGGDELFHGH